MMRRLPLALLPLALLAAACGTKTIKADGAEKSVNDLVKKQTGFQSTDTRCPDGSTRRSAVRSTATSPGPTPTTSRT